MFRPLLSSFSSSSSPRHDEVIYPTDVTAYEFLHEVGKGGSATVWAAKCKPLDCNVAVKVVDFEKLHDSLEVILKEAQTMRRLQHPTLMPLLCSFVFKSTLWMVMPYASAGSVASIVNYAFPEGLSEPAIATIMKAVLEGLEHMHANGYIHRDIKASNILLDGDGRVVLGDLGISAVCERAGSRSQMLQDRTSRVGTASWMAPEVLAPDATGGYKFWADIWSVGITLIELARGQPPLVGLKFAEASEHTLRKPAPTLEDTPEKQFSPELKEVVALCLNKAVHQRPSAAELLKHRFFKKNAQSPSYLVKTLLEGLPPLAERLRQGGGKRGIMATTSTVKSPKRSKEQDAQEALAFEAVQAVQLLHLLRSAKSSSPAAAPPSLMRISDNRATSTRSDRLRPMLSAAQSPSSSQHHTIHTTSSLSRSPKKADSFFSFSFKRAAEQQPAQPSESAVGAAVHVEAVAGGAIADVAGQLSGAGAGQALPPEEDHASAAAPKTALPNTPERDPQPKQRDSEAQEMSMGQESGRIPESSEPQASKRPAAVPDCGLVSGSSAGAGSTQAGAAHLGPSSEEAARGRGSGGMAGRARGGPGLIQSGPHPRRATADAWPSSSLARTASQLSGPEEMELEHREAAAPTDQPQRLGLNVSALFERPLALPRSPRISRPVWGLDMRRTNSMAAMERSRLLRTSTGDGSGSSEGSRGSSPERSGLSARLSQLLSLPKRLPRRRRSSLAGPEEAGESSVTSLLGQQASTLAHLQLPDEPFFEEEGAGEPCTISTDDIHDCQGLLFLKLRRGGLGFVPLLLGSTGFLIAKMRPAEEPAATSSGCDFWSGPCYVSVQHRGYGFGTGAEEETQLVMVLGGEEAVELFKRPGEHEAISLGQAGELAELQYVEGRGRRLAQTTRLSPLFGSSRQLEHELERSETTGEVYAVNTTTGCLLSTLPLIGTHISVNHLANATLYGRPAVTATEILEGRVPPPAAFMPLYHELNSLESEQAEAPAVTDIQAWLREQRDSGAVHFEDPIGFECAAGALVADFEIESEGADVR